MLARARANLATRRGVTGCAAVKAAAVAAPMGTCRHDESITLSARQGATGCAAAVKAAAQPPGTIILALW